ncbi:MAG: PLP-dependent aminotransferase family protein [bacterium]|jgi:2-aminoadipate transaminase
MSKYAHLYTPMMQMAKPSQINQILAGLKPDAVHLSGGYPDPDYFPREEIKEITAYIMDNEADQALQYGSPAGYPKLRNHIVDIANSKNQRATVDNVMVVNGSTEGFDLMCKVFVNPGDYVIIEEPSYSGAITSFKAHGCNLLPVPIDENGVIPEMVEKVLAEKKAAGIQVKFMYILPNYQNPAGVSLSLERRKALIEIAKKYNVVIFEDDAYIEFRYEGEELPTMRSLDDSGLVVYTTTFSKTFAPGTRLGWIVAEPELIKGLTLAKSVTSLMASPLTQAMAAEFSMRGYLAKHVELSKGLYKSRRDAMLAALEKYMPEGVTWTRPKGGYFLWVTAPEDRIDGIEMLKGAVEAGVSYRPGPSFYIDDSKGLTQARLCFSMVNEEKVTEGIRRFAEVIKKLMK